MTFKIKIGYIVGICIGLILIAFSFYFLYPIQSRLFRPLLVIGVFLIAAPFLIDTIKENRKNLELEKEFLEFIRAVSDGVKAGIPIPKAICELSDNNFGYLTPQVRKLIHQIEWGIPLRDAFIRFARDTNNKVVRRAMTIIVEAERSGGNVSTILDSVTNSVLQIRKIKEERKSSAFSQQIQGYFVFFIFIAIMSVLQVYLLPQLESIGTSALSGMGSSLGGFLGNVASEESSLNFSRIFSYLIVVQGFFAGLLVGKFAEGNLKSGLKHSLIMVILGYMIFSIIGGF
jgi:archaeal flagellar protein FlaJ